MNESDTLLEDRKIVVSERLATLQHEIDISQQLQALEKTRKETIAAISFKDLVLNTPEVEALCPPLRSLGLLDNAVVQIKVALKEHERDGKIPFSAYSFAQEGMRFCKFLLYAGDLDILNAVWEDKNKMDVYKLTHILEAAATGPLAINLMQKMSESSDVPLQLVNLLSVFRQDSATAQHGWKFAQRFIQMEDRETRGEVLPLLHRSLGKYVTSETAEEIFAYITTAENVKQERLEMVLKACARSGMKTKVWEYLRSDWDTWMESDMIADVCIANDTVLTVLEAYNPSLYPDDLPENFADVIETACLYSNSAEVTSVVSRYFDAVKNLDYPTYMRIAVALAEADTIPENDQVTWELAQKRTASEKATVLDEYGHFETELAQTILLKHTENPQDATYITEWLADQNIFENLEKFQIAALLYINTDQFPQFEQAAFDFFSTFKTYSGNWDLYVSFFALQATGSEKVQRLVDAVLEKIEPKTQIFKPAFRNELLKILNIYARVGDFSAIGKLLQEKESNYVFNDYIEDWRDELVGNNYPTIITPYTFRKNVLSTIPAEVRKVLHTYLEELNTFLEQSPLFVSRLAHLAQSTSSITSSTFTQTLSGMGKKLEVVKTGSSLHAFLSEKLGVVVNEIPLASLDTWQLAHDAEIPVSPILKTGRQVELENEEGQKFTGKRVFTRFSGSNLYEWLSQEGTPELVMLVDEEIKKITAMLSEHYIQHGHPHLANYTVEFVDSVWYDAQLAEGKTVNTLPFSEDHFTFDLKAYKTDQKKWKPIIRLIDWDRSVSSPAVLDSLTVEQKNSL